MKVARLLQTLLITALLLTSGAASAEVFKWKDKHGVVHYEDKPPEPGNQKKAAVSSVEKVELTPITILNDGKVQNNSSEKQDDSLLGKLQAQFDDLKVVVSHKIAEWTNSTPVVTNPTDKVEIYTTAWCGACKKAKAWFREKNIPFTEYDVEKDVDAALRMRKLGGGAGVPFAVINDDTVQGFSPEGYQALLH
jgi:glutaredoxin-like YruB-family protein